jgi:hypothetical protein
MKQTTIILKIEEGTYGATVFPAPARRKLNDGYIPNQWEQKAWESFGGKNWGEGIRVKPKNGQEDDHGWYDSLKERMFRVGSNRPYKTKVRWKDQLSLSVTFFWNKPTTREPIDTEGIWTLYRVTNGGQRRILTRIDAVLECPGEDLYCHLPEGNVPEGWEVFPDIAGDVAVAEAAGEDDPGFYYLFKFKATKSRRNPAPVKS